MRVRRKESSESASPGYGLTTHGVNSLLRSVRRAHGPLRRTDDAGLQWEHHVGGPRAVRSLPPRSRQQPWAARCYLGNARLMPDLRPHGSFLLAALLLLLALCAHGLIARDAALEVARLSAQRDAQAASHEHDAQLRLQLVGRALDPSRSVEDRQRVLRFLYAVTTDQAFKQWAEAELASLQPEVDAQLEAQESDAGSLPPRAHVLPSPAAE